MSLTPFQQEFKQTLSSIENDIDFIIGAYCFARNDEKRQKIIDGIKNGTLKTTDDVLELC